MRTQNHWNKAAYTNDSGQSRSPDHPRQAIALQSVGTSCSRSFQSCIRTRPIVRITSFLRSLPTLYEPSSFGMANGRLRTATLIPTGFIRLAPALPPPKGWLAVLALTLTALQKGAGTPRQTASILAAAASPCRHAGSYRTFSRKQVHAPS